MNINEVIKYPILTEKTYLQMEKGVYTFAVDWRTNKVEVRKVINFIFDVNVKKVNLFNVPKKPKKLGKFQGFTNRFKKAIVTLKSGEKIKVLSEDDNLEETNKKNVSKNKDEVTVKSKKEIIDIEKRVAKKIASKNKKDSLQQSHQKEKDKDQK